MIKTFLKLIALGLPLLAAAQTTIVRKLDITSVSNGVLGIMDDTFEGEQASQQNYVWSDLTTRWDNNAHPATYYGMQFIHTEDADKATTGDTTVVSFTTNVPTQVIVWHAAAQTSKPTWLTTNYTACGVPDITLDEPMDAWCANLAPGTINLGGNCPGGGCSATRPMYLVSINPSWRPLEIPVPGVVNFAQSSYTANESTTLTFHVARSAGNSGACSVTIAEGTNPSNGTLNTFSASWVDGESGNKSGTIDLASVASDSVMTLTISSPSSCALGSTTSTTINITNVGGTPSAADYYVNNTGSPACSDSNAGTSSGAPWCTISRANSVQAATGGGHTIIHVKSGTYVNQPWVPSFSGISSTQTITLCAQDGDVTMRGPTSGNIDYAVTISPTSSWLRVIECSGGDRIIADGQVSWGGGGASRGQDPTPFAHIERGLLLQGQNIKIDMDVNNTAGWAGIVVNNAADNVELNVNTNYHGTVVVDGGDDYGDTPDVGNGLDVNDNMLFDGGSSWRRMHHGGHSSGHYEGGKWLMRFIQYMNSWADTSTFNSSTPDGNRAFTLTQNTINSAVHDIVVDRNGKAGDQTFQECFKIEGTRTLLALAIVRNCHAHGIIASAAGHSGYARGARIAHTVFENLGGPMLNARDYGHPNDAPPNGDGPGNAPFSDYQFKNIIVRNFLTKSSTCCNGDQTGTWNNELIHMELDNDAIWQNAIQIHGATLETPTGNCANTYITINRAISSPGRQTVAWYLANHPNNFSNITCTTDANLDNKPAAGTDVTLGSLTTQYLPVSDSLSIGTGVQLTQASSSGASSTNLCVDDATWFVDQDNWSDPATGQWSGGYGVHIAGVGNRTYSNVTLGTAPAGCLTLDSAATWADNARVGYNQSAGGTTPVTNRGYVL